MRPTLFSLHLGGRSFGVHTYGLAVATGLALGIILAVRQATREGLPRPRVLDLAFWTVLWGVVASRALYVLLNLHGFVLACRGPDEEGGARALGQILSDCTYALRFWEGGLVFYGGVLGAGVVLVTFARKEAWSLGQLADLFTPGLPLGHALGRLGCFSSGCCFGKPSAAPWAVSFPSDSVAFHDLAGRGLVDFGTGRTVPLHPTQLYESLVELGIFVVIMLARWAWNRPSQPSPSPAKGPIHAARPGRLFALYLALYAPARFVLELFRGDAERRFVWPLRSASLAHSLGLPPGEPLVFSVSQTVSLALLLAVGVWWLHGRETRRSQRL